MQDGPRPKDELCMFSYRCASRLLRVLPEIRVEAGKLLIVILWQTTLVG